MGNNTKTKINNTKIEASVIEASVIDMKDLKSIEHFKQVLSKIGMPDDVIEQIIAEMPEGAKAEIEKNAAKQDNTKPDLKVVAGGDPETAEDSTARMKRMVVQSLIESAGIDPEQKVTIDEGLGIIQGIAPLPMPQSVKDKIHKQFKRVKAIRFRDFIEQVVADAIEQVVADAPDQAFGMAKGLVGLLDLLEQLKDLIEDDCGDKGCPVHGEKSTASAEERADKDPDGRRYVIEDMIVQRKDSQKFYKVTKATKEGLVEIVPVTDVVADPEDLRAMRFEPKEFNDFLRGFKFIFDPRVDEFAMDGVNHNSKH